MEMKEERGQHNKVVTFVRELIKSLNLNNVTLKFFIFVPETMKMLHWELSTVNVEAERNGNPQKKVLYVKWDFKAATTTACATN